MDGFEEYDPYKQFIKNRLESKAQNRRLLNRTANKLLESMGAKFCRVLRDGILSVQKWGIEVMEPTGEQIDGSSLALPDVGEFCVVMTEPYLHVLDFESDPTSGND